ncbi:MAG: [acyl-carrier-protein] S-malonyltransferase [Flavobacteriales bacterium]|nr:[acyl-carrier-protein] S-malonyltransferase [Flavobacteriales bacterium]|tara:strand:+ start:39 stop:917 length:879 start_codon:yes stop_codon:yes gene_type:complete
MKAFIFPGQGSQFSGMGFDLYQKNEKAKSLFHTANDILKFNITKIMFEGSEEDLKQTNVTQPAIFIHSTILAKCINNFMPDMVAGHSLGEFSALVATNVLSFEDGLKLVMKRAELMHIACQEHSSTMAAIIGLDTETINKTCELTDGIVVPANYNSPGQIVISGNRKSIENACSTLSELGAKRAVILPVAGAFHSPLMSSAEEELEEAINKIQFNKPICPIYQNVCAKGILIENELKQNLIKQLTAPVKWQQTIEHMIHEGATEFFEVGPGNVLTGLNRRINRVIPSNKVHI